MNPQFKIYAPAVLLIVAGFAVAFQFIKPAPPSKVIMASGGEQGAYHSFAKAYAKRLEKEGIELKIINTAGSVENIALLHAGKVDVAMVQGGIADHASNPSLESLGSLYFEPLWLFKIRGQHINYLTDLEGKRFSMGSDGSGTKALVESLLQDNGIDGATNAELMGGEKAAEALSRGNLDAAFFVSSAHSKLIQTLLQNPSLELVSFIRADAYARRYPFLTSLTLPEGVVDLRENIPAKPVQLIAPTANLVVNSELHPAVSDLLLQAATAAHGSGSWFEQQGEFPQKAYLAYPLSKQAARFYKNGPSLLQRYLPFWAASLIDRLKVMLLPLVLMMIPLFKVMPPIYTWRMRSRVYRWYGELDDIDQQLASADTEKKQSLKQALENIENDVRQVNVPLSFTHQLYHLREHIKLVKERLL